MIQITHIKTKLTLFRRGRIYYSQDSATGQQKSLRTRDEAKARKLITAINEAHRDPVLNLQLARAYLTASDPAFVERTWQTVMNQMQARDQESSRARHAMVFKSPFFDRLRNKRLLETTADDFLASFKDDKVSLVHFLKCLHHFALSLGWIALPIMAPNIWPKYRPKTGAASRWRNTNAARRRRNLPSGDSICNCFGNPPARCKSWCGQFPHPASTLRQGCLIAQRFARCPEWVCSA